MLINKLEFYKYRNNNGAKTFGFEFWWNSQRIGLGFDFWVWTLVFQWEKP